MGHDQEDTQIIMMLSKTKGRGEKNRRVSEGREGREGGGGGGGLGGEGEAFVCCV